MDYRASQVPKVFQVCISSVWFVCWKTSFSSYLGDVGEPGLGGGYSQPGQKGEIGMYMRKKDTKGNKILF